MITRSSQAKGTLCCVECDKFRHDEWLASNGISVSTNKKADDLKPTCAAPNILDTMTNMPSYIDICDVFCF